MMREFSKVYDKVEIKSVIEAQLDPALFSAKDLFASKLSDVFLAFIYSLDNSQLKDTISEILKNYDNEKDKVCAFLVYTCTHRGSYTGLANSQDLDTLANMLDMSDCHKLLAGAAADCKYFDHVFDRLVANSSFDVIEDAIKANNFALLRWAAINKQTHVIDKLVPNPRLFPIIAEEYYRMLAARETIEPLIRMCFDNYVFSMLPKALELEIKENTIWSNSRDSKLTLEGLNFSECHFLKYVIKRHDQSTLSNAFIKMLEDAEPEIYLSIARSTDKFSKRNEVYEAVKAAGNSAIDDVLDRKLPGISARWKISSATYKQYMKIFENVVYHVKSSDITGIFIEAAKSLLNDYTKGNSKIKRVLFFHGGRHHADAVQECLDDMVGNPYLTAKDLVQHIVPISQKEKFNFKGSLARRILFIQEQATVWGVLFEESESLHQVYDFSGPCDIKLIIQESYSENGLLA